MGGHGFDDAQRDVVAAPPQLAVDKTDHDVDILEAADDIAYDITMTNIGQNVPLVISSIIEQSFMMASLAGDLASSSVLKP